MSNLSVLTTSIVSEVELHVSFFTQRQKWVSNLSIAAAIKCLEFYKPNENFNYCQLQICYLPYSSYIFWTPLIVLPLSLIKWMCENGNKRRASRWRRMQSKILFHSFVIIISSKHTLRIEIFRKSVLSLRNSRLKEMMGNCLDATLASPKS